VKINGATAYEGDTGHAGEGSIEWAVPSNKSKVSIRKIEIKELPLVQPSWASLFNGKDLDGWEKPDAKSAWAVEDGLLVGRGAHQYLNSKRADFGNFHLRAEVKVNPDADGNLYFRAEKAGAAPGYSLAITSLPIAKNGVRTGAVLRHTKTEATVLVSPKTDLLKPNEWFKLEVIAVGRDVTVKINDVIVTEALCAEAPGRIAMGTGFAAGTVLQFRTIEIKEQPSEPAKQRFLRFDPAHDTPIDRDAIEKTQDGWKIDFDKIAAYYTHRTFRFFELRDLDLENCKVTLRGKMRTVARPNYSAIEASLQFQVYPQVFAGTNLFSNRASEPKARGTTSWAPYEVSEVFHGRPVELAVTVNIAHRGEVFLKDLELVIEPLPEAQRRPAKDLNPPPTAPPKLVRRWTPGKDSFISLDAVSVDKAAWKIHHDLLYRDTLRLFELKDHQLGPGTLILKARMRSDVALGYGLKAYPSLEFRPAVATDNVLIKKVDSWTATHRNENSAWYEARVRTTAAPELIAVNLSFEGHGTLWIEEIELLHISE
jgi:hypothetical protein